MQKWLKTATALSSVLFFSGCGQPAPGKVITRTKYIYSKKRTIPRLPRPKRYVVKHARIDGKNVVLPAYEFYNAQRACEAKDRTIKRYERLVSGLEK